MQLFVMPPKNYHLSQQAAQSRQLLGILEPLATTYNEKFADGSLFLNSDIIWLKQHVSLLNEVTALASEIIDEGMAARWIGNFLTRFNRSWVFSTEAAVIKNFISDVVAMKIPATYPADMEVGLRFYMGSKVTDANDGHPHHIVIVPVYNQTFNEDLPNPVETFEKDWMNAAHGNSFIALLGTGNNAAGSLTRISSSAGCSSYIQRKATTTKHTVYYSVAPVNQFVNNAGSDFSIFTIELALTDANEFTMILRCRDAHGNILESSAAGETGLSFDEGNLIPPPPLADSSF